MNVLVVGRFQPLHKGHEALLQQAAQRGKLTVVLGSAQACDEANPFSVEARTAMVAAVVPDARIVPLDDLHDPPKYAQYVLDAVGHVDVVMGHDEATLALFRPHVAVESVPLKQRQQWQGSIIRAQLRGQDDAWQDAVPAALHGLVAKQFVA